MEEASTDLNKEYLLIKNEIDRNIVDIRTKIIITLCLYSKK